MTGARVSGGQPPAGDATRLLLAGLVDYAGLFPPAALSMADATATYDGHRRSSDAWALGKFVVPVARLAEFEQAARPLLDAGAEWQLAAIAGADFGADIRTLEDFCRRAAPHARVGAIEVKASTPEQIGVIARLVGLLRLHMTGALDTYIEVPIATDPSALIESIASHGLRAKVRTGGVEAGAFPTAGQLAAFIGACVTHGVTFKATAGLHHAMRGTYPLTYEPLSARGTMFGFLNVFLAALFMRGGLDVHETRALLEELDARSFTFTASGVTWRGHFVDAESIRAARAGTATSFGSCSFAEPVADLSSLGLL
jgi:hypothetical protein